MLTTEEIEMIATKAVEKILLRMPEVIGNLMKHHATVNKANKEFYAKYPDFSAHTSVVASVIESVEGRNLAKKYEEILEMSVPIIRERIAIMDKSNLTSVNDSSSRSMPNSWTGNGVL